jgi:hypothetical protein
MRDSAAALKAVASDEEFQEVYPPNNGDLPKGAAAVYDIGNPYSNYWPELDIVLTIAVPVHKAITLVEADRPMVSQMLPMWDSIEAAAKEWHDNYSVYSSDDDGEGKTLQQVVKQRFNKNYHPVWTLAYLLDPLNFVPSGDTFLPNLGASFLNLDKLQGADKLLKRLAPAGKAADLLLEWMELKEDGCGEAVADYVKAVQRVQVSTGVVKLVPTEKRRLVWTSQLAKKYPLLAKVADRVLSLHATSCAPERNWSKWRWVYRENRSRLLLERAEKMIFVSSHAALKARKLKVDDDDWEPQLLLTDVTESDLVVIEEVN